MENQENYQEQSDGSNSYEYDDGLCRYCQQRHIDKSENPDSVLCGDCREKLIHYPIPKKLYAGVILVLVLFAAALFSFPKSLNAYKIYDAANETANSGYTYSTLENLEALMEEYPTSIKIPMKMVEIAVRHGYYDYAAYAVNEYLVDTDLTDSEYDTAMRYIRTLDEYYNTYDIIQELLDDESLTTAEEVQEQLTRMLSLNEYNKPLIYYYLAYTAPDDEKSIEYFQACYDLDHNYTDAAAQLANYYRRLNNLPKARELLASAYEWEKEDFSVLRSYAILCMLEGNTAYGLELAESAYTLYPEGSYVADTYIVALAANGRADEAESVKQECLEKGYEFDQELNAYLDGSVSLTDYYIGES